MKNNILGMKWFIPNPGISEGGPRREEEGMGENGHIH
jgi:hypothetical protein